MDHSFLKDLDMAGVCWELDENIQKQSQQNDIIQHKHNLNKISSPVIVPASAPITLEVVKSMANRPTDTKAMLRMIYEFNHPLRSGVTNVVGPNFANASNGLMIITDMPSSEDDLSGKILSGEAGDLMDKILAAIGMSRNTVSIVPLIFWHTPGNRTPSREELDLTRPFINRIIEMEKPKIILTLGSLAAKEVADINIAKKHGIQTTLENGIIVIPVYHPNYLLLKPSAKKDVWTILQNVQNLLKNS
ncbi:MAG: uracil-DNA glycosylase [Alphaproteobacteria bacterium]|nr:uracil-DNA glycosylase [Alphaproteobacteria bacterium]